MTPAQLRIRTPEGIIFAYPLAGPVTRCLAWAFDLAVILALTLGLSTILGRLAFFSPDLAQASVVIGYFLISIAYGVVLEWTWRGQTVGKRLFRLRVMDSDGLRLRFHQVLMRNLIRFADVLPIGYMVGGVACLLSRKAQRLGDLAAGTIVVHQRKHGEPDLDQLLGTKFNSLRAHPHLCARLRQRASPDEARLALQALSRREEFDDTARIALFADLADHFKSMADFPHELIEAIPDEQFVRNVADILFRTKPSSPVRAHADAAATPATAGV